MSTNTLYLLEAKHAMKDDMIKHIAKEFSEMVDQSLEKDLFLGKYKKIEKVG